MRSPISAFTMPRMPGQKYIPVLNGIRALAVVIVFASHASNIYFKGALTGFGGGQLGVMLFFILSGFLMAFLYIEKPATWRAQYDFLVNRFARVYPMFAIVVVACFVVNVEGVHFSVYPIKTMDQVLQHLAFVRGYNVLWTIGPEVIFYLLFLVLWKARSFGMGPLFAAAAGMALIAWMPTNFSAANSLLALHDKLPYFIAGTLLGMWPRSLLEEHEGSKIGAAAAFWLSGATFVAGLPQILKHIVILPTAFAAAPWAAPWTYPFYLMATAALFASALIAKPWILTNRAMSFIGKISFSVYLLHYIVLDNMRPLMPTHPLRAIALAAVATLLLSSLTYAGLEMPMRGLIRRLARWRSVGGAELGQAPPEMGPES